MTDTFRALCADLLDELIARPLILDRDLIARARDALSSDEPAVPEGREPASVVANPSDAELDLLVIAIQALTPHQPDATTHNLAAVNRGRKLLRDALTRWNRPAPAPPEGELADEELLRAYGKARRDYCHDGPSDDWPKRAERAATIAGLRAVEAAVIARCPAPAPQVEGEVAELVEWLRERGQERGTLHLPGAKISKELRTAPFLLTRIAELLQSFASPAALVIKPSPERLEQLKAQPPGRVELLPGDSQHQQATPVPVSERLPGPEDCLPWPDKRDEPPWCWVGRVIDSFIGRAVLWEQRSAYFPKDWEGPYTHWLPAHALPLPSGEVE